MAESTKKSRNSVGKLIDKFEIKETNPSANPRNNISLDIHKEPSDVPNTPPPTPEINEAPATTSSNHDGPEPPSYLTVEFLETALSHKHKNIQITSCDIKPAVAVGENYATIVFRANVNTNQGPFALIIKCIPETENRAKMANEQGFTEKERYFYNSMLPIFQGDLSENDPCMPNIPSCYFSMKEGLKDAIILQDMRPFGYVTANRQAGLDHIQVKLALKELAKLHALSIKLRVEKPELFRKSWTEDYKESMYTESNRSKFGIFLKGSFEYIAKGMREYFPYRYHSIADTLDSMIPYVFDWILADMVINEEYVLVFNHGDFWSSNILFQYENDKCESPSNCCLIDFQIGRFASPALDLHYFLSSSTTKTVRDAHMRDFLETYMNRVIESLESFGIHKPYPKNIFYSSMQDLEDDMKKNALFGLLSATMIIPIIVANKDDAPDMEEITDEEKMSENISPFAKLYDNKIFKQRYREVLDDLDDMGLFIDLRKRIAAMETTS